MCVRHGLTQSGGEGPRVNEKTTEAAGNNSNLAASSSTSSSTPKPHMLGSDWRRRSVDVGGLALALGSASIGDEHVETGMGWGSWGGYSEQEDSEPTGTMYVFLNFKFSNLQ